VSDKTIEQLEVRIAYQDDTINQLSDQLYAQSREIGRLSECCRRLDERLKRIADGDVSSPQDETPPHY
jgi:SlyX protein